MKFRYDRLGSYLNGTSDGLIDESKYDGSGWHWPEEAVDLFKDWWADRGEDAAIYIDQLGRKLSFKDYEGDWQYDFMLTRQSILFSLVHIREQK